jgi:hypothetical protein
VHNAVVKCSTYGGKPDAIEVSGAGGWTHAYQELLVVPDATYTLSGEFYALEIGECNGSAAVKWCSPSVVVCPGPYNGDYYTTGGCFVGLAPAGKDAWEPFETTFSVTSVSSVTVYINHKSPMYSSVVANLTMQEAYVATGIQRIAPGAKARPPAPPARRRVDDRISYAVHCWAPGSAFVDPSCNCLGEAAHAQLGSRPTIKVLVGSWCVYGWFEPIPAGCMTSRVCEAHNHSPSPNIVHTRIR